MSEVTHPSFGKGRVLRQVRGGRYCVVLFEGRRIPWQVNTTELSFEAQPPVAQEAVAEELDLATIGPALQILEALRLGVVPPQGTDVYTVGRDVEMEMIQKDLVQACEGGAARVVLGDYGTGKTHLLEVIEQKALEANMVVARVVLDEEECSPSQPRRVYRALCNSLRYPDRKERGLQPLFDGAVDGLPDSFFDKDSSDYHHYLSPTLAYYRRLDEEETAGELLLDYIGGHPSLSNRELERELRGATGLRGHRLYALMDYRPWAHLYTYLVGGLAYLVERAGYRGICLLFDEAEFYALLNRSRPRLRGPALRLLRRRRGGARGGVVRSGRGASRRSRGSPKLSSALPTSAEPLHRLRHDRRPAGNGCFGAPVGAGPFCLSLSP